ncbi:MAG: hypothetical protein JWP58_1782 [Hymenobacter sp.]|nr:hypothetical protein [Hymenobacter sp.]
MTNPNSTKSHKIRLLMTLTGILFFLARSVSFGQTPTTYHVYVTNYTNDNIWVATKSINCLDARPPASIADVNMILAKNRHRYTYTTTALCTPSNLTLSFKQSHGNNLASLNEDSQISMDMKANRSVSFSSSRTGDRIFFGHSFAPQSDSVLIYLDVLSERQVDLRTAVEFGCKSPAEIRKFNKYLLAESTLGTSTKSKYDAGLSPGLTTQLKVTMPVQVFRGPTFTGDNVAMEAGYLSSKAIRTLRRPNTVPSEFYQANGPRIEGTGDSALYTMRQLAIGSSDVPVSQTISIALNFATAFSFKQDAFHYVYAFKVVPDCELFGIRRGVGGDNTKIDGELQFQILGGTPITDVMRTNDVNGLVWEKRVYNEDTNTTTWVRCPAPVPVDITSLSMYY